MLARLFDRRAAPLLPEVAETRAEPGPAAAAFAAPEYAPTGCAPIGRAAADPAGAAPAADREGADLDDVWLADTVVPQLTGRARRLMLAAVALLGTLMGSMALAIGWLALRVFG